MNLPKGDPRHGNNGYSNLHCRCDICRAANAAYNKRRRAERWAFTAEFGLPPGVKHNANTYHNWGCKCDVCRTAHNQLSKAGGKRRRAARGARTYKPRKTAA